MANQQHIDWLLEGVEAWNARRERDNFSPDFEDANLHEIFADPGKLDQRGRIPLEKADLQGTDLQGTILRGADFRSIRYSRAGTNDDGAPAYLYTDLSLSNKLTLKRLYSMTGDSGTILAGDKGTPNPNNLTRPKHWPDLPELVEGEDPDSNDETDAVTPDNATTHEAEPISEDIQTSSRAKFLLQRARGVSLTAGATAFHLETEVLAARQASNQIGPEIEFLEEMVLLLNAIADETSSDSPNENELATQLKYLTEALEKATHELNALQGENAALKVALEKAQTSEGEFTKAFKSSSGKALGAAAVAAPLGLIAGGMTYLLGPVAQVSVMGFAAAAGAAGLRAISK